MNSVPRYLELSEGITKICLTVYLLATIGVERHMEVLDILWGDYTCKSGRILMAALCEVCYRTQLAYIYVNALASMVG